MGRGGGKEAGGKDEVRKGIGYGSKRAMGEENTEETKRKREYGPSQKKIALFSG